MRGSSRQARRGIALWALAWAVGLWFNITGYRLGPEAMEPYIFFGGWTVIVAVAVWGLVLLWTAPATRRRERETETNEVPCPQCGYDLRGLREVRCPECGFAGTLEHLRK